MSIATLAAALGLLEGATRVLYSTPAPYRLRDGIYTSAIPKAGQLEPIPGEVMRLEERKRPGEVRIFVLGESSVAGEPWGRSGSPATMLYDQLRSLRPNVDLTLVNMGWPGAYTMDMFYALIGTQRFAPDYIVFYMGGNDAYQQAELCAPSVHPSLFAAWAWVVSHSRFFWWLRVASPLTRHGLTAVGPGSELCDPVAAFGAWTHVLIRAARDEGARVVVTSSVENELKWPPPRRPDDATGRLPDSPYRMILLCLLSDSCDVRALWLKSRSRPPDYLTTGDALCTPLGSCETWGPSWPGVRSAAWKSAAAAEGATFVDFLGDVVRQDGAPLPPLFVEELHLSLEGYWRLAWSWARTLAPLVEPGSLAPSESPALMDRERYLGDVAREKRVSAACLLLRISAMPPLESHELVAASLLRDVEAMDRIETRGGAPSRAGETARLLRGWLRQRHGQPSELPAPLAALLPKVNPEELRQHFRDSFDCASVGWAP